MVGCRLAELVHSRQRMFKIFLLRAKFHIVCPTFAYRNHGDFNSQNKQPAYRNRGELETLDFHTLQHYFCIGASSFSHN